jgi:hypothetical protein
MALQRVSQKRSEQQYRARGKGRNVLNVSYLLFRELEHGIFVFTHSGVQRWV